MYTHRCKIYSATVQHLFRLYTPGDSSFVLLMFHPQPFKLKQHSPVLSITVVRYGNRLRTCHWIEHNLYLWERPAATQKNVGILLQAILWNLTGEFIQDLSMTVEFVCFQWWLQLLAQNHMKKSDPVSLPLKSRIVVIAVIVVQHVYPPNVISSMTYIHQAVIDVYSPL